MVGSQESHNKPMQRRSRMLQMGCNWWEEIDSHPERISKLARFEADFDWSGIGFPVSVKDIKKFR